MLKYLYLRCSTDCGKFWGTQYSFYKFASKFSPPYQFRPWVVYPLINSSLNAHIVYPLFSQAPEVCDYLLVYPIVQFYSQNRPWAGPLLIYSPLARLPSSAPPLLDLSFQYSDPLSYAPIYRFNPEVIPIQKIAPDLSHSTFIHPWAIAPSYLFAPGKTDPFCPPPLLSLSLCNVQTPEHTPFYRFNQDSILIPKIAPELDPYLYFRPW